LNRIKYNTDLFNFSGELQKIILSKNLSNIHNSPHFEEYDLFSREKDQSTKYHKLYYDNFKEKIEPIYKKFISEIIRPLYKESIIYQKIPTFRLHFPGNIAVGEYHKDKWYRDSKWHSDVCEMNYYLPFTQAFDTNTVWVESEEDKGDYEPIESNYGECIEWDGVNLMHGNKKNTTDKTRISVDFRVISESKYKPSNYGSINTKVKFEIGGYYLICK
tara:strand:- start:12127 stop:12777 length:651 start_codon:yes stop_codon:yes gene_type:complete